MSTVSRAIQIRANFRFHFRFVGLPVERNEGSNRTRLDVEHHPGEWRIVVRDDDNDRATVFRQRRNSLASYENSSSVRKPRGGIARNETSMEILHEGSANSAAGYREKFSGLSS